MADVEYVIVENVDTIEPGLSIQDIVGVNIGTVREVNRKSGYVIVETGGVPDKLLYIPFHVINAVELRGIFISMTKDELHCDYGSPPARTTTVAGVDGKTIAMTMEASGYEGTPVVVEHVVIDDLKPHITAGYHVYTLEMIDLGAIKSYDPATGWMLIEQGIMAGRHDLMVPVTLVQGVDDDNRWVYLVASQADLKRLQRLDPACVVFA